MERDRMCSKGDQPGKPGGDESRLERRPYARPRLIEYGRIAQLTRGSTGKTDDFNFTFRP